VTGSLGSFGRYQLLDVLGRGGMGEVFRAHDSATDRVVAIKLLPAHLAEDPDYRLRFQREAHTAAGLNDPHVVPIHSYGEIDGRLYVDMRLIEGRDLGTVIVEDGGRLQPERAVAIIEQVASALDAAHDAGLVHRDVKPSNILIAARDFAYIDFGIARAAAETAMTGTGQTVGTLAYMAPERFSGMTDHRADVYSLACVLYECLTGQRPFPGDSPEQQLAGHLTVPPPRPSATCPDVPSGFDSVIARGMAKSPDERYQSAMELATAARSALTPATAVGPWLQAPTEHVPRPMLARPRSAGARIASYLAASLTLLIVAYLVVVLVAGHDRPDHSIDQQGGTRITLTARTPDGTAPSREALSQTQRIINARAKARGIPGTRVVVEGDHVVVTVPGDNGNEARQISQTAVLYFRPVIESVPAQLATQPSSAPQPAQTPPAPQTTEQTSPPPADPRRDLAERIRQMKELRQSGNSYIQMVAMRYVAAHCGNNDILAGNDDPKLPLVTCSTDHKTAYLLAPSIISGDQIQNASSGMNQQGLGYVVDLQFKPAAANTWADFTAAHIGTQIAYTLDSQVMSAPVIREAIPGGRTQIQGGDPPFTAAQAADLANVLNYEPLPLSFESSEAQPVPPNPDAARRDLKSAVLSPPTGVIAALIALALSLFGMLLYLTIRVRRSRHAGTDPALRA
jgi:protein-export membrane protein SecD